MKKMILSVALIMATFGAAHAKNDEVRRYGIEQTIKTEIKEGNQESKTDSTHYITRFYDVDRIVIKNDKKQHVKIYNTSWNLIKETDESVNIKLTPGNYYVETCGKIKTRYVMNN